MYNIIKDSSNTEKIEKRRNKYTDVLLHKNNPSKPNLNLSDKFTKIRYKSVKSSRLNSSEVVKFIVFGIIYNLQVIIL